MEHLNYTTNSTYNQTFRKKHFNHLTMSDRLNIEELLNLKNNKNYNDIYERYGLDGIQKMKHVLEEKGIFWRKENEKNT